MAIFCSSERSLQWFVPQFSLGVTKYYVAKALNESQVIMSEQDSVAVTMLKCTKIMAFEWDLFHSVIGVKSRPCITLLLLGT